MRGGQCGCAGRCPRRTRVWSRCTCPRACEDCMGKEGVGSPTMPSVLASSTRGMLTDSNPSTIGPSVPGLPGPGPRVCLPTRSSCQAPPSAHHMEGQACKARRDTRGQASRRRPGPTRGKCRWANGGGSLSHGFGRPPLLRLASHPAPPTFPRTLAQSLGQPRGRPATRPEGSQRQPPTPVPASSLGARGRVHGAVRPRCVSPT